MTLRVALLIAAAALSAPAQSADPQAGYVLGIDDQILVRVLDLEELDGKDDKPIRVDMRGNIRLPIAGRLKVAGLTVEQVEAEITKRLNPVMQNPEVTVTVAEKRSHPVSVLGSVKTPGVHQITGNKTLSEILSLAGGISPEAGNSVKITRRKSAGPMDLPNIAADQSGEYAVGEVKVKALMEGKDPQSNITILPNDVVTVPKGELVYVVGAVKRSGGFVLNEKENITVLQAISLAEGFDRFASKNNSKILRPIPGGNERQEIALNVDQILKGKAKDVPLQANDILFVPISGKKAAVSRGVEAAIGLGTGMAVYRR